MSRLSPVGKQAGQPRNWKLRLGLQSLMFATLGTAILLTAVTLIPKSTSPSLLMLGGMPIWTMDYVGLGWVNDDSWLGFRVMKFSCDDPRGAWEVIDAGKEFNPVKGFYPNGSLLMEGACRIYRSGRFSIPDIDDLDNAICLRPDGTVAATVVGGNGTLLFFFPTGEMYEEARYINYELVEGKLWLKNGTLANAWKKNDSN